MYSYIPSPSFKPVTYFQMGLGSAQWGHLKLWAYLGYIDNSMISNVNIFLNTYHCPDNRHKCKRQIQIFQANVISFSRNKLLETNILMFLSLGQLLTFLISSMVFLTADFLISLCSKGTSVQDKIFSSVPLINVIIYT